MNQRRRQPTQRDLSPEMIAHDVTVGSCGDPACRGLHIQFVNQAGVVFAQAVVRNDRIPDYVADVVEVGGRLVSKQ